MNTTQFLNSTTPLRRPPRRLRPPFDVDDVASLDSLQPDETADQWHVRRHADRVTALLEPLDGIELGEHDRRVIEWLSNQDNSVVGTVASLLYRARAVDGAW
ncbi:hypothetical protein V1227_16910 [Lentzea sp. DG1S-22]|uniref:hypothetical protein n=1 Tax=Lentzea sp. DG1S-22 TaxID=3108822 RepID=UPI002E7837F2|nr:hypothetical protein [Lentzea sp. DG1S-22]WVH84351.1 hypothetical protein V1227_16910 [Lentzea sp. DG1S-22]